MDSADSEQHLVSALVHAGVIRYVLSFPAAAEVGADEGPLLTALPRFVAMPLVRLAPFQYGFAEVSNGRPGELASALEAEFHGLGAAALDIFKAAPGPLPPPPVRTELALTAGLGGVGQAGGTIVIDARFAQAIVEETARRIEERAAELAGAPGPGAAAALRRLEAGGPAGQGAPQVAVPMAALGAALERIEQQGAQIADALADMAGRAPAGITGSIQRLESELRALRAQGQTGEARGEIADALMRIELKLDQIVGRSAPRPVALGQAAEPPRDAAAKPATPAAPAGPPLAPPAASAQG